MFVLLNLFISGAMAQDAAANQPGGIMSFVPFIAIFFIFYFLMIRPQQKKLKAEQEMLGTLKKGDEVYTKSGIIGTIHGLTDKVATLDLGNDVKAKVLRSYVGGLTSAVLEGKKEK